jgi:pimeloyl-ACP methyl ester carboxylesterase
VQAQKLQIDAEIIAVYQSVGKGPAALLIHGNSCSSRSFQHQLDGTLGAKYRLVAMDLPGHGRSARASNPQTVYNLPGYARVAEGVVEQLGLSQAVLVGWSLGGHIALEAVNHLPSAAGFMIFGTPPLAFPPAMTEAFLPSPAMAAAFNPTLSENEARGFAAACLKPGAAVPDFYLEDIRSTDGQARAMLGTSIAPNGYTDEVELVAQMKQPLAILHGEHEQLVSQDYIKKLKMPTLWRGAIQIVAGAGHSPHWEQPEKFNALLEAFLRDTNK